MRDSRLLFTLLLGIVVVGLFVHLRPITPQEEKIRVEKLRDDLYVLFGGGGNTAFYVMKNSVLVVDAKTNLRWSQQILDQIRKVTLKPVRYLVNTHYHGDHTRGNLSFPKEIEILSHKLTRQNLMEYNADFWREKMEYVPNVTFTEDLTIYDGDSRVELVYLGAAHTNGDAVVVFPEYKTAHLGDLLFNGSIPIIDAKAGGSSRGYVQVLKRVLQMDIETFIPGHGEITDRTGVLKFIQYHQDLQAAVQKAIDAGLSLEEAKQEVKLPKYASYRRYERGLPGNVEVVYRELTATW
jgi:glyoxylase-like metal-dependent hydrolase (beta-lactamase superfamily II)